MEGRAGEVDLDPLLLKQDELVNNYPY